MNKSMQHRIWGSVSPLACLSGAALVIMASTRLAHALIVLLALLWVYCLSSLAARASVKIFPRTGRVTLLAFLSSFFASLYLLLLWIISPLCAIETFFVISIVPMFCVTSGVFKQLETLGIADSLVASFSEALALGVLIVIFAFIREPIGYLSLSLPGGARGLVFLFSFDTESFLPVRLIAGSCGALILLGYCLQLYRYFREKYAPQEDKDVL